MTKSLRRAPLLLVAVYLPLAVTPAATSSLFSAPLDEVSRRLLAVSKAPDGARWPPQFEISEGDAPNAYASGDGKDAIFRVVASRGLVTKVIEGDDDRLAFVLGHELAHILLGHTLPHPATDKTTFLHATFTREQELAADQKGMALTLAAGYSFRRALKATERMLEIGLEYSSFEGLGADHPSWKERIEKLDKEQASLWKAMSAFDNGVVFLNVEQYVVAERCFRAVTREFPLCYEAWSNLGYALLMQYCDALETDDLKRFGIGQLVCGGFYSRSKSLEAKVRGVDEEVWWDAVGALREAMRLNPNLALTNANLGLAYLVRPAGKDVGQANRYIDAAENLVSKDDSLDPLARAALLINKSVAELASGRPEPAKQALEQCERIASHFVGSRREIRTTVGVSSALLYDRAMILSGYQDRESQTAAIGLLESYLKSASRASAWWPIAHDQYVRICRDQHIVPKTLEHLGARSQEVRRPIVSVRVAPKVEVALDESVVDLGKAMGDSQSVPVVSNTNLVRIRYPAFGVDLIANDRVLAICLGKPTSPALPVRGAGLGSKPANLRVGMSKVDLDAVLQEEDYDFRQLIDPAVNYRFYRNLGLAVRLAQGKVEELIVVQMPDKRTALGG